MQGFGRGETLHSGVRQGGAVGGEREPYLFPLLVLRREVYLGKSVWCLEQFLEYIGKQGITM